MYRRKSLPILAFVVLASWWASDASAYSYCTHQKADGSIGKHCTPCGHTDAGGNSIDALKSALGSTCLLAASNKFTGLSHIKPVSVFTIKASPGSGNVVSDQVAGSFEYDHGATGESVPAIVTERFDADGDGDPFNDPAGDSAVVIVEGSYTGVTFQCVSVKDDPNVKSRLIGSASCGKGAGGGAETWTVDRTATEDLFGHQPSWCPPAPTPCVMSSTDPNGLPSPTTKNTCSFAFPAGSGLKTSEIAHVSVAYAQKDCVGVPIPENLLTRLCGTQSWDVATYEGADTCIVKIGTGNGASAYARHILGTDAGFLGNGCGEGSGSNQGAFKTQICDTQGKTKYACTTRPAVADEDPGFNATTLTSATLNGSPSIGVSYSDFNGDGHNDAVFDFSQCDVASKSTVINGTVDLLFTGHTDADSFAFHTSTLKAQ